MHIYGCYFSILLFPLKNRMPQNFTIVNFGQPFSECWLRPRYGTVWRKKIQGDFETLHPQPPSFYTWIGIIKLCLHPYTQTHK